MIIDARRGVCGERLQVGGISIGWIGRPEGGGGGVILILETDLDSDVVCHVPTMRASTWCYIKPIQVRLITLWLRVIVTSSINSFVTVGHTKAASWSSQKT